MKSAAHKSAPAWRWLVIALALPTALLAQKLTLDLWADEVYTLYEFASQPVSQIVRDYSAPNNHIFYTLLLKPVATISTHVAALRLPSLVLAVLTLATVFALGALLFDRVAAVAASLTLGLNVMFLTHAMQLRGYGVSMALTAGLMWLAARQVGIGASKTLAQGHNEAALGTQLARALATTLGGAALLYTVPTNALFFGPLTLWVVARGWKQAVDRRDAPKMLAPWLAAWLLAVALYAPVLEQVREQSATPWAGIGASLRLVGDVLWAAGHDLWPLWLVALALIAVRKGSLAFAAFRQNPTAWSLLAVMLLGPFIAAIALGITPFVRNFCPLLPAMALATGGLISMATQAFAQPRGVDDSRPVMTAALAVIVVMLPAVLVYPSRLERVRKARFAQDGYYNYYAAHFEPSCAARALRAAIGPAENYRICFGASDHHALSHALAEVGFPLPPEQVMGNRDGGSGYLYVVLPARPNNDEVVKACGASMATVEQWPVVAQCGYYEVRRSPERVTLK